MTASTDFGLDIGTQTSDSNLDPKNGGVEKQYHFVKLTATGVDVIAAGSDVAFGVIQNKPRASQSATVRTIGMSKVVVGAAVAKGEELFLTAAGRVVNEATAAAGDRHVATALEAATADGQIIAAYLAPLNGKSFTKA